MQERKWDCNYYTGFYPPLTIAAKNGYTELAMLLIEVRPTAPGVRYATGACGRPGVRCMLYADQQRVYRTRHAADRGTKERRENMLRGPSAVSKVYVV